jgi:hypothetical protein
MNDNKTLSMLQRIPMILAVTAASYGLPLHAQAAHARGASGQTISRTAAGMSAPAQPRLLKQR